MLILMDWGGCHPQKMYLLAVGKTKNKANNILVADFESEQIFISFFFSFIFPWIMPRAFVRVTAHFRLVFGVHSATMMIIRQRDDSQRQWQRSHGINANFSGKKPSNHQIIIPIIIEIPKHKNQLRWRQQRHFSSKNRTELRHTAKVSGLCKARWTRCVLNGFWLRMIPLSYFSN